MTALVLSSLVHHYQKPPRAVLDIPYWELQPGQQILLRGHSGSGKTTLLNIMAGLLTPTAGSVSIDGESIYRLSESARDRFRARHLGYIFQTHNLLPLTALENVEMPLAFAGMRPGMRGPRAKEMLERVGLGEFIHNRPAQLSVGQRLRVAAARALVNLPHLLLADEPTAALDEELSDQLMDLIQAIAAENRTTLIIASHDPLLSNRFKHHFLLHKTHLEALTPELATS